VRALTDAEIARAVASDPDAAPILDEAWFRTAELLVPAGKQLISLRLDREVVQWFKRDGPRYQSRINAVLRAYLRTYGAARRTVAGAREPGEARHSATPARRPRPGAARDAAGRSGLTARPSASARR
jgi:uncharacterized protein (DUF4415 family)